MSSRKINITTQLDFITGKSSIADIDKQIRAAIKRVELEMDINPKDRDRAIKQLESFGEIAKKSFSETTQQINKQLLDGFMVNTNDIPGWDEFDKTLRSFGIVGTEAFNDIKNANQLFNKEIVESETALDRMGQTLTNTIRWNISSKVVNSFTGAIQEAYYFAKDLDRELTNIQIVSGTSADEMARFAEEANESAKALGSTTVEYAKAATLFYQQGLRGSAVTDMTDAATLASNITGEEISSMSDLLTSTMNGYKLATGEVMNVVDMMANVGANTAADFNELATAMSKVASMASSADVPMENLIAQIATIVSTTRQSPETVGTALKTVYGRMVAFKTDLDAVFEEDGEVFSAPAVEEAIQAFGHATDTQLTMFETAADGSKQMRELGDILNDVGNAWGTTTDKAAKFGLTTAMAGNRQQNNLVALFDSWDTYTDTVSLALEAEGTGLEQNEIYLDSYAGKLQKLQATKEELFMVLTDSEGMKNFIDLLIIGVEQSTKLIEAAGGVSAIIGQLGGVLASLAVPKGLDKLGDLLGSAGSSGVVPGPDYDAQIKSYREIQNIQKAFGSEEAERHRESIRRAELQHKNSRVAKDLYDDELTAIRDAKAAEESRAKKILEDGKKITEGEKLLQEARSKALEDAIEDREKEGHSAERLIHLKELQEELSDVTIKGQKLVAEQTKGVTEEGHQQLANLEARAKEIEDRIARLKGDIQQDVDTAPKVVDAASDELDAQRRKTEQVEQAAQKRLQTQAGINTLLKVGIPLIATARDTTSETSDLVGVIKVGLLSMLPELIGGMSKFVSLASAGGGIVKAFTSTILPGIAAASVALGVIVAIIRKANKETRELEQVTNDYEEALDMKETHEENGQALRSEQEQILENIRQIEELENPTGEDSYRLEQYKKQNIELEQQIAHEEYLAELAAQEASERAFDLLGTEQTSEYAKDTSYETFEVGEYKDNIEEVTLEIDKFRQALPYEELGYTTEALEAMHQEIERNSQLRDGILQKQEDGMKLTVHEGNALEELAESTSELGKEKTELLKKLMAEGKALKEIVANAKPVTEAEQEMVDNTYAAIDAQQDLINMLTGAQAVTKDGIELSAAEVRMRQEQSERVAEYYKELITLMEVLDDVNASEEERLMAMDNIAEAMSSILDIDIAEDFFHQAENVDLLRQAMEGSDAAWLQLRMNMLGAEIDIAGLAAEFNVSGDQITQIMNALDQLSFTADGRLDTTAFFASLEDMGEGIGMANALLDQLGSTTVDFHLAQRKVEMAEVMGKGIDGISTNTAMSVASKFRADLNRPGLSFANPLSGWRSKGTGSKYTPTDPGGGRGGGGRGGGGRGGGGSGSKPRSGSGSGSSKEDYKAVADRYVVINSQLERNNILLDINSLHQEKAADDITEKIRLMEEEITLNESRQGLLHDYNKEMRKEARELQRDLSGIFNFKGSWEDNSMMITNLKAIDGQSKEIEEKYNRILEIMGELPSASQDWHKIQMDNLQIAEEIKEIQRETFEYQRGMIYSTYQDGVDSLEYRLAIQKELLELTDDLEEKAEIEAKISRLTESQTHLLKELNKERKFELEILKEQGLVNTDRYRSLLKDYEDLELELLQRQVSAKARRESIADDVIAAIKDGYRKMLELERAGVEHRLSELEEEHDKRIRLLDDWLAHHNGIVDEMLRDMNKLNAEEDYEDQLSELREEKAEIEKSLAVAEGLSDSAVDKDARVKDARKNLERINKQIDDVMKNRARTLRREELEETKRQNQEIIEDKKKSENIKIEAAREAAESEIKIIEEKYDRLINSDKMYESIREEIMKGTYTSANEHITKILNSLQTHNASSVAAMGRSWQQLENIIMDVVKAQEKLKDAQGEGSTDGVGISKEDLDKQIIGSLQRDYEEFVESNSHQTIAREKEVGGYLWRLNRKAEDIRGRYGWEYENLTHLPAPGFSQDQGGGISPEDEGRLAIGRAQRQYMEFVENNSRERILQEQKMNGILWKLNQEANRIRKKHGWDYEDFSDMVIPGYASGGVVDYTGIAQLHGSKSSPEVVFNAGQAKKLFDYVNALPNAQNLSNFRLPDVASAISKQMRQNSGKEQAGGVVWNVSFNIDEVTGGEEGGRELFGQFMNEIKLRGGTI